MERLSWRENLGRDKDGMAAKNANSEKTVFASAFSRNGGVGIRLA